MRGGDADTAGGRRRSNEAQVRKSEDTGERIRGTSCHTQNQPVGKG